MHPQPAATFDRFSPDHVQDPYPLYDRLREQRPFLDETLGLWIVARYDDVRTVLADHERFSSAFTIRSPQYLAPEVAAVLQTGHPEVPALLNQDPPDHGPVRALVKRAFSPRRVRQLTPTVQRLTDQMIDRFDGIGHADLVSELGWPLPLHVTCVLLGLPVEDARQIRTWIDALTELTSYATLVPDQVTAAHQSVAFERYLAEFVTARRAQPGNDLTSELLSETDPALSDDQMISLLINLIFAGHETTANLIGNTLLALLAPPSGTATEGGTEGGDDRGAGAEAAVEAAIEETLRYDPPVQAMFRRSTTSAELGETTIPDGAMVLALIGAADRDPDAFDDPNAFRPGRSGPPSLSFGRGVHFCLGAQTAKMEARVAICTLLRRLPGLRLAPDYTPPYLPNLMHRGPRHLDVLWNT